MHTTAADNHIEHMTRDECLRLIAGDEVGRLAVIDYDTPAIFPVNYVVDGETVVFRTGPGTKLRGASSRATFEVDAVDRERRTGWSVVAFGRLEEVTRFDPTGYEHVRSLPVAPWTDGEKAHWMRLIPDRITGRRIVPADSA